MNYYYLALDYIKSSLEGAPFLNTITQGLTPIDTAKKNIFPLAHINPMGANVGDGAVLVRFEVTVMDIRNVSKAETTTKFEGNDNEIDNLNTTLGIITHMLTKLKLSYDQNDIEVDSVTDAQPMLMTETNMLDGWRLEIMVSVPNNILTVCCDD